MAKENIDPKIPLAPKLYRVNWGEHDGTRGTQGLLGKHPSVLGLHTTLGSHICVFGEQGTGGYSLLIVVDRVTKVISGLSISSIFHLLSNL